MSKKLPLDHPSALPRDHEVFDYPSYYHFQDTFSNYHFDKWTDCNDPSNEIHRNLQFVGKSMDNVMSEVLPFVRENGKSG